MDTPKLPTRPLHLGLAATACLFLLGACGDDSLLSQPESVDVPPASAAAGPNVAASASGGANWTLTVDFGGGPIDIDQVLAFNAQRSTDGDVHGRIVYHQTAFGETFSFQADVSCIGVYDGNRGKFGGPVTKSNDATIPVGTYIWFHVIDGGQGAGASPDFSSGAGFGDETANQEFCDSPALPNPVFLAEVTSGNIEVR
jgi:hypothetical protein